MGRPLGIGLVVAGTLEILLSFALVLRQEFLGAAAITAGLWVLARPRPAVPSVVDRSAGQPKAFVALQAAGMLSLSAMIVFSATSEFRRDPAIFAAAAALYGFVFASIAVVPDGPLWRGWAMAAIVVFAVAIPATVFFLFPVAYGVDPFFHSWFASRIVETGHVPRGMNYSFLPGMHVVIAVMRQASGLGAQAALFVVGSLRAVGLIGVYLLARRLNFGARGALAASALLACTTFFLYWGFWVSTTIFAYALWTMLLVVVVWAHERWTPRQALLILILFLAITFAHSLTSLLALTVLVVGFPLGLVPYGTGKRVRPGVSLSLVLALTVVLVAHWSILYEYSGQAFVGWLVLSFVRTLTESGFGEVEGITRFTQLPMGLSIYYNVGYAILVALMLVGAVRYLTSRPRSKSGDFLFMLTAIFFGVIYGASVSGVTAILPHRWFVYALTLGTLFAAAAVRTFFTRRRIAVVFCLALVMSVPNLTNNWTNSDSPFFNDPTIDRYGYYPSELAGARFYESFGLNDATTDFWFRNTMPGIQPRALVPENPRTTEGRDVILRDYVLDVRLTVPVEGGFYVTERIEFPDPLLRELNQRTVALDTGSSALYLAPRSGEAINRLT